MIRNEQQNKILHTLLAQLKIDAETKKVLVYQYTNQRTISSADMDIYECQNLINHLRHMLRQNTIQVPITQHLNSEQMDKQRKRLIAKFREMGYNTEDNRADMPRINETLKKHWHKTINEFSEDELPKIIAVVEHKWIPNFYQKSIQK